MRGDAYICPNVIAARRCLHVPLLVHMNKAHFEGDCCGAMHACACLCVVMHKAYAHSDCCEAMHVCSRVFCSL
jgi:hypothetical protein